MRIRKVEPVPGPTLGQISSGTVFRFESSDQMYLATDRCEESGNHRVRHAVRLASGITVRFAVSSPIIEVDGEFVEASKSQP